MPTVKIEKQTQLPAQDTFERISKLLENDKELRKLDSKYACTFDPQNLSGQAGGSHFKADMKVSPVGEGSKVEIKVDLPFHLSLVKGIVEKTLSKKLEEALS
jgi:hypothetical protein